MNVKIKVISALLIFISLNCLFAQSDDSSAPDISFAAEAYLKGEYTRGSYNYGEGSLIGTVNLNDQLEFRLGAAIGTSSLNKDVNVSLKTEYSPFSSRYLSPLNFSLFYLYNGLPEFYAHTHSILPLVSYTAKRFGAAAGVNFRFTSFFDEAPQFETILSLHLYFNFIANDTVTAGIGAGNISDFHAKNFGALSLKLNVDVRLNNKWSILSEIEVMQSGMDGLTATFYGFSWRGGAKYSW